MLLVLHWTKLLAHPPAPARPLAPEQYVYHFFHPWKRELCDEGLVLALKLSSVDMSSTSPLDCKTVVSRPLQVLYGLLWAFSFFFSEVVFAVGTLWCAVSTRFSYGPTTRCFAVAVTTVRCGNRNKVTHTPHADVIPVGQETAFNRTKVRTPLRRRVLQCTAVHSNSYTFSRFFSSPSIEGIGVLWENKA